MSVYINYLTLSPLQTCMVCSRSRYWTIPF